jgi:hypothetical protein
MAVALSGCLTGTLIESGRLHERVLRYERIAIDERDLVIGYTVEVSKSATGTGSASGRRERRNAMLSIEELDARPPHPADAFPLRRLRSWPRSATPLTIRTSFDDGGGGSECTRSPLSVASHVSDAPDASEGPQVEITERAGRHLGFRVCAGDTDRGMTRVSTLETPDHSLGYFYSAALYDDHLAWWIYPLAPFTFAIDIALLPIQVVTLPPLLLLSD